MEARRSCRSSPASCTVELSTMWCERPGLRFMQPAVSEPQETSAGAAGLFPGPTTAQPLTVPDVWEHGPRAPP
jgi:hypothetical protein